MELSSQGIPIIDLFPINDFSASSSDRIIQHISNACETAGCFYVKNHGIDETIIENVFRDLHILFSQPKDFKLRYSDPSGNLDRGYEPFQTRNINAFMGRFGFPNDPVEKIAFGPPSGFMRSVPDNIWPGVPTTLRQNIEIYYEQVRVLAEKLMKLFSVAAHAPSEDFFYDQCYQGEHILRANFYPNSPVPTPTEPTRFGEHTDSTPFTILAMDDCPKSLQVKNEQGEWIYADPIAGSLFVNLGDFMAIWTNNKWKATVHKVVWSEEGQKRDRLSLIYFLLMNPGVVVECLPSCVEDGQDPNYKPTSHADYVNARMARLSGRY